MGLFLTFACEGWEVVLEDDDRSCHAYLLRNGDICSDVWLYNRVAAPTAPEWTSPQARDVAPFLNAVRYVTTTAASGESWNAEQVSVTWADTEAGEARVLLGGEVAAVLRVGAKPGWSARAIEDGPLAKVLRT